MKKCGLAITIFFLSLSIVSPLAAQEKLRADQMQRLRHMMRILQDVDKNSEDQIIVDITYTQPIEGQLQLREIIAETFQDLTTKFELTSLRGKRNLYQRIQMNMAFLQMGGMKLDQLPPTSLDQEIVLYLKKQIPKDLVADERLFYTLEE